MQVMTKNDKKWIIKFFSQIGQLWQTVQSEQ